MSAESLRATVDGGLQLLAAGAVDEAYALLSRGRTLPGPAIDRYALGIALLQASNACDGWDLYDLHPSRRADRILGLSRWDGQPCAELVLVAEQGFGDAIQFLRYVPNVRACAESTIVAIHDELYETVSSSPLLQAVKAVPKSQLKDLAWSADTRWERLMSLPIHIRDGVSRARPVYLVRPRPRPACRLPATPDGVRTVGIAWRSTPRPGVPSRSIDLRHVTTVLSTVEESAVRVVSLHRIGDVPATPVGVVIPEIRNFVDTAAVIGQCDVVITVDTVTAHLAPALGVPTLVCLRRMPDWRWGVPARPTTWYTEAELVFQDLDRSWPPVLRRAIEHAWCARPGQLALSHDGNALA
jgi:hypothetical protein